MSNIVAIVGRPNVGKSTIFNRLIGERRAIVDEQSGVTRDRTYGKSVWNGVEFTVIDSGGYIRGSDDVFEGEIRKQVEIAINEASVVMFVVDVETGIMPADEAVASMLRKSNKPVMVVVNKVDNHARNDDATEFYNLGLGDYYCISGISGAGTGDLLDELVKHLEKDVTEPDFGDLPKFAIVGRPNVGKSSFTNALLGEERNIVTDISGTTRDAIHTRFSGFGFDFMLVDTAGIRKKKSVHEDLEFYSVLRSVRAIESCDVCILMLDATQGFEGQDMNILHLAQKNHKGIVILVNKWDLVEKDTHSVKEYTELIHERIAPFTDVPILFVSVLNMQRIHKALETAVQVFQNRNRKIPTRELNEFILPIIENRPPPMTKGKSIKIKFVTQLPTHFPAFAFFCSNPQYLREDYKRFLENQIREHYDFSGVPVEIYMRRK
jgi:GTP-binding protein